MHLKFNPFPIVYVSVVCEKHECRVLVEVQQPKHPIKQGSSQVQMTPIRCEVGGNPITSNCEDNWIMLLDGPGPVTVMS